MQETPAALRAHCSTRVTAFDHFLRKTQQSWATALQTLESGAEWQVEHRPLDHHDSVIYHIHNGEFLEKAGINYSIVTGESLPAPATQTNWSHLANQPFLAMGLSTILHPKNPFVPTAHCNLRYFQTLCDQPTWWFAGVMDLTPFYGFDTDCVHWHQTCFRACSEAGIDRDTYDDFKKACDQYYYLPHRQEHRGIGGLWIEHYHQAPFSDCKGLIESVGAQFMTAYLPIAQRRQSTPYSDAHRAFQLFRRNRYVEFNLLYDRGTKFGLSMGSRAESILISMPPQVSWPYNWQPIPGSAEAQLHDVYLQPRDWLS